MGAATKDQALVPAPVVATQLARPGQEIAAGLFASPPPPDGDLVESGTGWLLARGSLAQRLVSPPSDARALAAVFGGAFLAFGFDALFNQLLAGIAGLTPYLALVHSRRIRLRRRMARLQATAPNGERTYLEAPDGTLLRVTGTVVAVRAAFPSLFRGVPCVLSRSALGGADELRGIDFDLRLDDGQQIRVAVRDAHVVDEPTAIDGPPRCGPVYSDMLAGSDRAPRLMSAVGQQIPFIQRSLALREAVVAPGDRVEVTGVIHHEVAADGSAAPGRQTPMRHTLRAGPDLPLLVRRS